MLAHDVKAVGELPERGLGHRLPLFEYAIHLLGQLVHVRTYSLDFGFDSACECWSDQRVLRLLLYIVSNGILEEPPDTCGEVPHGLSAAFILETLPDSRKFSFGQAKVDVIAMSLFLVHFFCLFALRVGAPLPRREQDRLGDRGPFKRVAGQGPRRNFVVKISVGDVIL